MLEDKNLDISVNEFLQQVYFQLAAPVYKVPTETEVYEYFINLQDLKFLKDKVFQFLDGEAELALSLLWLFVKDKIKKDKDCRVILSEQVSLNPSSVSMVNGTITIYGVGEEGLEYLVSTKFIKLLNDYSGLTRCLVKKGDRTVLLH